ncbi:hypothetical protein ACQ5SK_14270 [Bradyrhizobium japonicum]
MDRGSELDFPKLAGSIGGQIRITEQPPLIFHPGAAHGSDFLSTLEGSCAFTEIRWPTTGVSYSTATGWSTPPSRWSALEA